MKQISTNTSLLTRTFLADTDVGKHLQAPQVIENYLKKEENVFPSFSSGKDNSDFVAILVAVGVILAGTSVSVIRKALNRSKLSVKMSSQCADSDQLEDATNNNKQNARIAYLQQGYTSQDFRLEDAQTAIAQLNNAISVNPHDAYLYTERARFRSKRLGDFLGAIEDYTKAINIYPNNAVFYLWRSQLYQEIGDMLKAMADYNTAIRLAPEDRMYHCLQKNANIGR